MKEGRKELTIIDKERKRRENERETDGVRG